MRIFWLWGEKCYIECETENAGREKVGWCWLEEEGKQKFAVSAVCRRKCRLAATIFEATLFWPQIFQIFQIFQILSSIMETTVFWAQRLRFKHIKYFQVNTNWLFQKLFAGFRAMTLAKRLRDGQTTYCLGLSGLICGVDNGEIFKVFTF